MEYKDIILQHEQNVATITLNRPQVLNALSPQGFEELKQALEEVASDDGTRAVIITGAGSAFCSGGDVKLAITAAAAMGPAEYRNLMNDNNVRIIKKIAEMKKPVIAAINGVAVGGGLEIALACDIRFASDNARLGEVFAKRGVIPDLGGPYFLPRIIGISKAKLLVFTGDIIDAAEAEKIGLVDKVFPAGRLMPEVNALAQRIAKGATMAISTAKELLNKSLDSDLGQVLDETIYMEYFLHHTDDYKEGWQAVREKREPRLKGR